MAREQAREWLETAWTWTTGRARNAWRWAVARRRDAVVWAQVLGGWSLGTWAVQDALVGAWPAVVWKGSGALLLLALVGRATWRHMLGYGPMLLAEMDEEQERERERRRRSGRYRG